jgi:hypothetical protein
VALALLANYPTLTSKVVFNQNVLAMCHLAEWRLANCCGAKSTSVERRKHQEKFVPRLLVEKHLAECH